MDEKSLIMLEYAQVIEKLSSFASFDASKEMAKNLRPYTDEEIINQKLELTREARHLLSVNDTIRLGACFDLHPAIEITRRGGALEADILWRLSYMLSIARDLNRSFAFHQMKYPKLAKIAEALIPPRGLIETLNAAVSEKGELLDSASEKLAAIRREKSASRARLLGRMEKMLRDSRFQPMFQESIITQRNNRYVFPLKAEYKGRFKSIVHDQSASGVTLFVEPLAMVELNNACHELELSERNEEIRILQQLSARVCEHSETLSIISDAMAEIDFSLMCACYADSIRATEPLIAERKKNHPPVIKLYEARHPLLCAESVVPIDVVLDNDIFSVVITGPNTGGKTVSLKTIGLMTLMAQSGLHIPAQSGSELSVFSNVFADIGDEQSIEQSLSTFSGHMTNIIRILRNANQNTLVLMDELGSGTDPQEGAVLARAIMKYMTDRKIPCMIASHFSELKAFAHITKGVTNASMEFDIKTLRPTYRLSIGLPGRSNALLISEKLGLPQEILEEARKEINPDITNTDSLLDEINRQYDVARKARSQADRMRSLAENSQRELQKRLDQIEIERRNILEEAKNEAQSELDELKKEISKLRRDIQKNRLNVPEISQIEKDVRQHEKTIKKVSAQNVFAETLQDSRQSEPFKKGDKVRVRSLGADSLAVINNISENEAEIMFGTIRMRVPIADLMRKNQSEEDAEEKPKVFPSSSSSKSDAPQKSEIFHPSPGVEIDLRGLNSDEMSEKLDKYLDEATLAGLPYVRIIHGKGTGKLRQLTRRILLDNPAVKFIETGQDNEGGSGVTIAHMKS